MKYTVVFDVLDDNVIRDVNDFNTWLQLSVGNSVLVQTLDIYPGNIVATDYELDKREDG